MKQRSFRWSHFVLMAVLSPAVLHLSNCGNPHLSALEIEAGSLNRVVGFGTQTHTYKVWTDGADTIVVRATASEASSTIDRRLFIGGVFQSFERLGVGSGAVTLTIPPDMPSELQVDVNHNGVLGRYTVEINPPCVASECDDANQCKSDACVSGTCAFTSEPDGTVCDFASMGDSTCQGGACQPTAVACGDLISGSIDEPFETDSLTLIGQAGEVILLSTAQTSGFGGSNNVVTAISSPSDMVVDSYVGNSHRLITLPESGAHTITFESTGTGTYNFGVECLDPVGLDAVPMALGDLVSAGIDAGGEVDLYTFSGNAGDEILLSTGQTSGFGGSQNVRTTLYSPNEVEVVSGFASQQSQVTLPETGTYVISVRSDSLVGTGTYGIGLEGLDPVSPDAVPMALGDLVSATIDAGGEVDLYTFSGNAGDEILLSTGQTSGFGGSQNVRTTLYSPSEVEVVSGFASQQSQVTLPETGTYVISVRSDSLVGAGTYGIGLEGLDPVSPDAVPMALGDLVSATIDAGGEVDLYTFSGNAGDEILLSTGQTSGFGGSQNVRTTLYSPSEVEVVSGFASQQSQVTLPETGTYVISVRSDSLVGTGTYGIGLEGLDPVSPDAVPMVLGNLVSATIDAGGEVDLYTFSGNAGDEILLTTGQTSGFGGSQNVRTTLYSPSEVEVVSGFASQQSQVTLPETGTYVISVRSDSLVGAGTYGIGLEGLDPVSPDAVPMALGDLVSATIDAGGEVDLYTFSGNAGDEILLSTGQTSGFGGSQNVRTTLYSPNEAEVVSGFASQQSQVTLPETGTYVISVRSDSLVGTGTYGIGLEGLDPVSPDAVPMAYGDLVSATIDAGGEVDLYTFSGNAGDEILLTTGQTSGFGGSQNVRTTLYSPSEVEVVSGFASHQSQVTLSETGTYVISVRSDSLLGIGTYDVELEQL